MWKINNVKSNGRSSMRKNYGACLIVCLILTFIVNGPVSITETIDETTDTVKVAAMLTSSEKLENIINKATTFETKFREVTSIGEDSSKGVISGLYHGLKKTGGLTNSIVQIITNVISKGSTPSTYVLIGGFVLTLLFTVFVKNILIVGKSRFFMENKLYSDTSMAKILTVYRVKKIKNCSWIMFLRSIFLILWMLTIVGVVIKYYSYKMIPYILAENPEIPRKEAFRLSMEMMKGNKFRAFLLDLSFALWIILSILTFGIVKYLYLDPYRQSAYAELYFSLREISIENKLQYIENFKDDLLIKKTSRSLPDGYSEEVYPVPYHFIPEEKTRKWKAFDYHRNYIIWNLILLFFAFSLIGWIWECSLHIVKDGIFVNRGSLYGPWIPIYGFGGVFLLVLLKRFVNNPLLTFIMSMLVCGVLEGATGWYLDVFKGMRYWNYTDYYFNINGYVCLESMLLFGVGGSMFIFFLAPIIDTYLNKIPKKGRITLCGVLVAAFTFDSVYSHYNPHVGDGIGGYVDHNK